MTGSFDTQTRKVSEIVYREDLYPRIKPDAETIQRYAENVTAERKHDVVVLQSEDLWIGTVQDGMFCANKQDTEFCKAIFRVWLDTTPGNEKWTEAQLRDKLAKQLKADGWLVTVEQYTSQGRIDILAERDGKQRIIETKLDSKSNNAAHALGQLLFYVKFYPNAELIFAAPTRPDETVLSILRSYKVDFWEIQ